MRLGYSSAIECGISVLSPRPPFVFVGEKRSARAITMNVRWTDGRLAARTLIEALEAIGIEPSAQRFVNVFRDVPDWQVSAGGIRLIRQLGATHSVVGMGRRVQAVLDRLGINHVALVHPAARGAIRRRDRYHGHVAATLGGAWVVR